MTRLARAALLSLLAFPAAAHASPAGGLTAVADLRYAGPDTHAATFHLGLRLWRSGGWAGGLDLAAGGGTGFAYEALAWPLGLGARLTDGLDLAIRAGGGVEGVTGARSLGAPLALELTTNLDLHPRAHLTLALRAGWVAFAPSRNADLAATGADELTVLAGLRLGRTMREYNSRAGRGFVLQAGVRVDGDGTSVVVGVGVGADIRWAASPTPFVAGR